MISVSRWLVIVFMVCAAWAQDLAAQTLAAALDTTNFPALVWTTSPTNTTQRPFLVETGSNPLDGADDAVSGNKNFVNSVSWIETTVVGPGTVSYWVKVSCEPPETNIFNDLTYFDYHIFEIGGVEVDRIAGPLLPWQFRSFPVPAGTNTLRWSYFKDDTVNDPTGGIDQTRIDQVKFETSAPMTPGEALGTCGPNWISGGNTNPTYWIGQTNFSVDGKTAESGSLNFNEESYLRVVVSGVSNVSFLWRVSSKTNVDWLEFYTNGYVHNPLSPPANYATRISGEVISWRSNFFKLPSSATNTLTWRYVRANQQAAGDNRGWLDKVVFNSVSAGTPFKLTSPTRLANGNFQFLLQGSSNCLCQVQSSTNLAYWTTLGTIFTTNATTTITDTSNGPLRFYRGVTP